MTDVRRAMRPKLMKHSSHSICSRLSRALVPLCVLVAGLAAARAETVENLEKSFSVKQGGQLVVDVDFGAIEIASQATDEVSIHVTRSVSRGAKADEEAFLKDRPVTISQDGDTVTIRSKAASKDSWSWKGRQRIEGRYVIAVPAKFNAQARTAGGAIAVREVDGEVKVNTSGGDIHVDGGGGSLNGNTSGGSVSVKSFRGPVTVNTSGGGVRIEGVAGPIHGSTSGGSVLASLPSISDSVKLTTSGGDVTLRVPADAAFDLDAATSGGSAGSDLPVTISGKKSDSRLKGPVNGGGKPVVLRSSGGDVWVKKI
ncbi:MAG: DUF4097 family beta strand repeat protein [Verrucomicrobiales bacterium]|nr:DUF4097 family beta strand repeat protein [Verrucomicrobiales bacterium]